MKKSEAIAHATDASIYKYPYQNLSLVDMEGEIWKELPQSEGHIEVSNYGRIKRLSYLVFQNSIPHFWTEERIVRQIFFSRGYKTNYLQFEYRINNKVYKGITARAVYSAFIKPISYKEDKLVIRFKDENPLNVTPTNLYVLELSKVTRMYMEQGIISPPVFNSLSVEKQNNVINAQKQAVSQYDLNGNFIRKFDGIMDASRECGLFDTNIIQSCRYPNRACGGYLWRYGTSTEPLSIEDVEAYRNRWKDRSLPVAHYSSDGKLIAKYRSISEAARKTGFSADVISLQVHGNAKKIKNVIFKLI